MWAFVHFSFRFICPELSLSTQLEKFDPERLDSEFVGCRVYTVTSVFLVGLWRKLFFPHVLIVQVTNLVVLLRAGVEYMMAVFYLWHTRSSALVLIPCWFGSFYLSHLPIGLETPWVDASHVIPGQEVSLASDRVSQAVAAVWRDRG